MGILYTSGLFIVEGAKEGVIRGPFYKTVGVGDLRNEPRLLRMGVSIVELNFLDINCVYFHNSSHYKLQWRQRGKDMGDNPPPLRQFI